MLAARISALDHSNPLPTSRLDYLRIRTPFGHYNDYSATNNAYYKATFIEVINIELDDTVFGNCILYEIELGLNNS